MVSRLFIFSDFSGPERNEVPGSIILSPPVINKAAALHQQHVKHTHHFALAANASHTRLARCMSVTDALPYTTTLGDLESLSTVYPLSTSIPV
jgi:hypothetical protein